MSKLVLPKKKIVAPAVSPETMALPGVAALYAVAQQAADEMNGLLKEQQDLKRELARLKKAKRKALRSAR